MFFLRHADLVAEGTTGGGKFPQAAIREHTTGGVFLRMMSEFGWLRLSDTFRGRNFALSQCLGRFALEIGHHSAYEFRRTTCATLHPARGQYCCDRCLILEEALRQTHDQLMLH
jgi:hypothetical protein